MLIRETTESDLQAVHGLICELAENAPTERPASRDDMRKNWDRMRLAGIDYVNYVAVDEDDVVGFISLIFYRSFYHRNGTALINELIVSRSHRRRGIATALVRAAEENAAERMMDELEVGTMPDNHAAIAFYRKNGFTEEYLLLGKEL